MARGISYNTFRFNMDLRYLGKFTIISQKIQVRLEDCQKLNEAPRTL